MAVAAGVHLGPYEILEPLGEGGMGEVYRARDTRLDRTVAIKILPAHVADDPVRRERFDREARTIATLTHPHICTLYDVGHQDGVDFLVLEHLEGETLEVRLRTGPVQGEQALRYGIELADALDQAHRCGIVHRDVKPANIIVTRAGVKLLDFGLAQLRGREALSFKGAQGETTSLTAEGTILGTLHYMAPEQIEGHEIDHRTDLFALGAVLYEMATGEKAFRGDSPAGQMAAILTSEPPPVSAVRAQTGFPRGFDHLVQRCLAKDPDARWQSARDVMLELSWMAGAAVSIADIQPAGFAEQRLRGRMGWAVAALLGVVAIVLAAVLVWNNRIIETPAKPTSAEPVLHTYPVEAPENGTLSANAYFMAVSPDGRNLAFVASAASEPQILWIRPSESTTAYPLPHTEGAVAPFWSPDGRSIAFVADNKLKKIDVGSRNVMELADDAAGFPGAWSPEGIILFYSGINKIPDHLDQVRAQGGPVTQATIREGTEVTHHGAYFLPDGRHFLFVADGGPPTLYLATVDSLKRLKNIPVESYDTRYVWPDYLVWHRGTKVFAQRFDVSTFRTLGTPSLIAEHVRYHRGTDSAVYSASSSGVLAYREVQTTRLAWFDKSGSKLGLIGEVGAYSDPALSPDGKKLAVTQFDPDSGTYDIWLRDVESGLGSRLSFNPADDIWPVWSIDGKRILFASNRSVNRFFDLFIRSIEPGGVDEPVVGIPAQPHKWPIDWTSDGRILYRDAMAQKMSILAPGGKPTEAPPSMVKAAVGDKLSPDSQWLAFTDNWTTGGPDVFVAPFPAGDVRWQISRGGGAQPRWRRDGKELFYLARDGRLMAVAINTGHGFHAEPPRPLFQTTLPFPVMNAQESLRTYDVTPDGQRFLLNEPVGGDTPITILLNWTAKLVR